MKNLKKSLMIILAISGCSRPVRTVELIQVSPPICPDSVRAIRAGLAQDPPFLKRPSVSEVIDLLKCIEMHEVRYRNIKGE